MHKVTPTLLINPIHFLSLGCGAGLSPIMPGTMGTLVAVIIYCLLPAFSWSLNNSLIYLAIIILSFIIGIFLCAYTERILGEHDHSAIVLDEIVGFFITMFLVPFSWLNIILGFVLFRIFDILKPWPILILDQKVRGGFGIMLDDAVAALYAVIILHVILYGLTKIL